MNPEELQRELIEKLNALKNRLLYDIDYDEEPVIAAAKQLLGKNAFPLSPRLDGYRLLIFAAFASAMANDELAEYDTFYNRLSEIFFENAPIDVNRQNQIRDFVEETCKRFNLRFLKNQNRLVRNTIWLHGGLPSRHWQNFFEYVLMKVDDNLGNLDTLLNPLTPRTIKRFFDHCGDSARAFLRDCIEMREVALSGELDNYSAEDFGVSENFLNAFREFLKSRCYERRQRQIIVFDETQLRVIDECTGQVIQPTQDIYAFRANGKRNLIRRGYKELPRKPVILIYHKDFTIPATIRRIVEKESLTGVWKDYVCEWLDLINQTELRLEHRADKDKNFTIDVVETPNLELEESPVQLAGRSVFCKADFEEVEVYNVPPTLCIENLPPQQRERARLVVNNREINIASDKISLASHITDGIIEIRLRGVRGRPTLKIAYFPELKLQLDKAEYRADETPTLSIGDQRFALQSNRHRVEIKFKGFVFSIPIPRKAWRITGKEWSSEPLSLRAQDLPSLQAQSFLEIAHIASSGKLIAKSGDTDLLTTLLRFEDGFCKVDLLRFRDIANANQEVELHLSLEGAEAVPLLRIYRSWQPEIKCEVSDKTVKFRITDNAAGFKNREIVCWNLCRLWEKPVVVSIPDGATEVEYAFEHDGEYVIEPRVKQTGWSKPKEPSPFDVPVEESEFSFSFKIGDNTFEKFKSQRENSLLDLLFERDNDPNTRRARISINEYLPALVYMIRHKAYYQTACNWLHLFLALREEIKGRFQVALYSEQHKSIELLRAKYEETVLRMTGFIGQPGIVSGIISRFPDGAEIAIALTAYPTNSGAKSGFLLCWNENPNHIRLTNVDLPHFLGKPRFVTTESLGFYSLLSQRDGNRAIATVGIAKKPLILCFQPVQLNQSQFKLIWRVLEADKVEITSFGEVEPQGERTVEPEHGQVFTLVAKSGHRSSHRSISTKFHSPHVKTFEVKAIEAGYARIVWDTIRAAEVRIEPNLGRFEPSGETRIPIDILRQLRLVAKNKAGEIEKHLESLPHNVQWAAQTLRPEPPHIEAFAVEKADECTTKVKVIWRVSNVEKVEIRPIGEVKPSGEALIDIVLLSGLTIMARSPVEVIEKKYKPEPPSWFQENKYVELEIGKEVYCACVFRLLQITKQFLFAGPRRIDFDILFATEDSVAILMRVNSIRIFATAKPTEKRELSTFNLL